MNREKIHNALTLMLAVIAGGFLIIFFLKRIIPVFSPFLIAWAVAFAVRDPAKRLSKKIRVPERILRVFIALFIIFIAFGALSLAVWQLSAALWRFLSGLDAESPLFRFFESFGSPRLPVIGEIIPAELSKRLSETLSALLSNILTRLGEGLTSWVRIIPTALFFLLVTVISLIYFCIDLERINAFVKKLLPKRVGVILSDFRREAFSVMGKYARSYLIILGITFSVMLSGFLILGVENAAMLAFLVALVDLLPILGVGTVLVPWGTVAIIGGNVARGVGLIVLFLVNTVIRQLVEPKIVGKNLNLHPVLALASLYAGYALFGFWGLFSAPIVAILVGYLFKNDGSAEITEDTLSE